MHFLSEELSVQKVTRTTSRTTSCTDPFFCGEFSGGGGSRSRGPTSAPSKTAQIDMSASPTSMHELRVLRGLERGTRLSGQVMYAWRRVSALAESGKCLRSESACMAGNLVKKER